MMWPGKWPKDFCQVECYKRRGSVRHREIASTDLLFQPCLECVHQFFFQQHRVGTRGYIFIHGFAVCNVADGQSKSKRPFVAANQTVEPVYQCQGRRNQNPVVADTPKSRTVQLPD
ncbi:hypothetical protein BaRGS_00000611 [Batillaria attramentaria]|uniref:Uncharacterized protein n=1 Tax=Batillaria attramentaria TaxID=370345 RepID=A0ABD0M9X0_9CAEN